jgi:hypothetical protein
MIKEVVLDKVSRRKDRSVSYTFITSLEQTSEQLAEWDSNCSQNGIIYFKTNGNLTQQEVNEIESVEIEVEGKTKSQRLRNVLYVYCQQQNEEFNKFYSDEMERIIQHYKDKLL